MQTVGAEGTRNTRQQDARPTGSKPVTPNPAGRSQAGTARPVNSQGRPVQTQGQPVRQAGNAQSATPQGKVTQPGGQSKPATGVSAKAIQKPGQANAAQQRQVHQSAPMSKPADSTKADQNWKKNINDDDDEFEFEFLNWDGEEK